MLSNFSYKRATSINEAVDASSAPSARILAGGTDLLGCLRERVFTADTVVSLNGIEQLKGISATSGGGLRIGALTTLTEVANNRQVLQAFPVLAQAAASAASPQLRNQGTIGGNLCQRPRCWYFRGDFHCLRKGGDICYAQTGQNEFHCIFGGGACVVVHPSDTAPALVALGAQVRIAGPKGARTIPLAEFFVLPKDTVLKENVLEPGDVVTEILVDPLPAGARSMYRKVRDRGAFDFALTGAAVVIETAGGVVRTARVVLSGVAPAPWRSSAAEAALVGKPLNAETVAAAAQAAVEGAEPLSDNAYKVPLVRGMLQETLLALAS